MTLPEFNKLSADEAREALIKCCGSVNWANSLLALRPFENREALVNASDRIWETCTRADGLEAFTHHPKIGDLKSLEQKFASTKEWAGGEQSGVNTAGEKVLVALAAGNAAYEKKFGFIFIVCASGKSATEMLDLLNQRIGNDPEKEWMIAMKEQNKITRLRLEKLIP
jgi:2-oxo-4-hydroxy-4-carboxy-5-ureidoimidazoline decarboxylase